MIESSLINSVEMALASYRDVVESSTDQQAIRDGRRLVLIVSRIVDACRADDMAVAATDVIAFNRVVIDQESAHPPEFARVEKLLRAVEKEISLWVTNNRNLN